MDGLKLVDKVYTGYAKAALRIGFDYDVYRASSASNPTDSGNKITTLKVSLNQKGDYKQPNTYGKAIWWSYHDGRETVVGDYLVGRMGTFFIASQQDLLPIQCVECNRIVTIARPAQQEGVGALDYQGYTPDDTDTIMTAWPCSILQGREKDQSMLPMDTKLPAWIILMPTTMGISLRTSDIITDDLGHRYGIGSAELTDLGWRLTAIQLQS